MVNNSKLTTAPKRKGKRSRPNNNSNNSSAAMAIAPAADPSAAASASAGTTSSKSSAAATNTVYSSSMESYVANANGTSIRRIRTPHPHDVLSGRGGGINSHPGNVQFRTWVSIRKNDYNLALNKADKATVAKQVVDMVRAQDPPGRFLTKDPTTGMGIGGGWWVELDDERTMAKTAQALREGAPAIRAEHADELLEMKREVVESRRHRPHHHHKNKPKSRHQEVAVMGEPSNDVAEEEEYPELVLPSTDGPQQKRVRVEYNGSVVRPTDATPPLLPSEPILSLADLPPLEDHRIFPLPPPLPKRPSLDAGDLKRAHSLAFSEDTSFGEWAQDDFVNPFEGDDEMARLEAIRNSANSHNNHSENHPPPALPSRTNFFSTPRETSTTSSHGDMGGISSLLHGNVNGSPSSGGGTTTGLANHRSGSTSVRSRTTSLGNVSSRYELDGLDDMDSAYGSSDHDTTTTATSTMDMLRDALFGPDPLNLWFDDGDEDSNPGPSSSEPYFQWWELPVIPRPVSPSLTSILSDLPDATSNAFLSHGPDFMEGMKSIYDALHADDDYREAGDFGASFPAFPLPYRGGNGVLFSSNHLPTRRNSSLASRGLDGRQ